MKDRRTPYGLLKPYEKCKTCQYRAQKQMPNNCDYILITGHIINKFWRKLGNGQRVNKSASECIQNLVEEIADVQVMLEQVKYLLSIREDEVSDIIEQKLDRQIERIKNE